MSPLVFIAAALADEPAEPSVEAEPAAEAGPAPPAAAAPGDGQVLPACRA